MKIAILGSYTTEFLVKPIQCQLTRSSINAEIYAAGFNLYQQEILDPSSNLYDFCPDIIILILQTADILPEKVFQPMMLSKEEAIKEAKHTADKIVGLGDHVHENMPNAIFMVTNLNYSITSLGLVEGNSLYSSRRAVNTYNDYIEDAIESRPFLRVVDYQSLIAEHGSKNLTDPRLWYLARSREGKRGQEILAKLIFRYIHAEIVPPKKCLVLDLDNTLWGGVCGEDGLTGINLGHDGIGLAFLEFQKLIKNLKTLGIILCISSKNNLEDVTQVFTEHPDMFLNLDDFTIIKSDWRNKVTHLREMAEDLNLGLDSFVFFDDNPIERELIRQSLPDVAVIEVPEDPSFYKKKLLDLWYFDFFSITAEDQKRSRMYRQVAKTKNLKASSSTLEEFFYSLKMKAHITRNQIASIPRISQLTQKTNQFNLTTRRYSESKITEFMNSSSYHVYGLKLSDCFGDNGLVGLGIIKILGATWKIDSLLLSCRVIGRDVETALLSQIAENAKRIGAARLVGEFIPSGKNSLTKNFFQSHKFKMSKNEWVLELDSITLESPAWVKVTTDE